jgi:methylphosphotriester-DNA--protein-cysteine methyltransferase
VLADRRLNTALRLIHAAPARAWSLPELARAAAMSRTTFATRFRSLAGIAPLAYLAQWRMRLAQRWLAEGAMPIGQIARAAQQRTGRPRRPRCVASVTARLAHLGEPGGANRSRSNNSPPSCGSIMANA